MIYRLTFEGAFVSSVVRRADALALVCILCTLVSANNPVYETGKLISVEMQHVPLGTLAVDGNRKVPIQRKVYFLELGVWMSYNQIFVNGKLAPSMAPCK